VDLERSWGDQFGMDRRTDTAFETHADEPRNTFVGLANCNFFGEHGFLGAGNIWARRDSYDSQLVCRHSFAQHGSARIPPYTSEVLVLHGLGGPDIQSSRGVGVVASARWFNYGAVAGIALRASTRVSLQAALNTDSLVVGEFVSRLFWIPAVTFLGVTLAISGAHTPDTSSVRGVLLTANKGARAMGIIDPVKGEQVAQVPENGVTGHEVIASPDGQTAYVPIYGDSGVGKPGSDGRNMVVIDIASQKVTGNIDFGHGVRPHCPLFGPKDGLLYVTTELDKTISIIDPHTLRIVGTIPTGQPESHMLVISHDGRRGYTANVGPGTVSVLDLEARKTITVIPISQTTQRISISPDDSMVFTSDQTKPQLAVIDTSTNKIKKWVPLPAAGYGTAATSDGKWLVVAVPGANKVAVVDLQRLSVVHTVDVPKAPQEVLIRPDDKMAYVSCDSDHKVAAISTADWKVQQLIDAGKGTDGLAWAVNR
jgi:DNA-binding beta-propeller fold protein YncE